MRKQKQSKTSGFILTPEICFYELIFYSGNTGSSNQFKYHAHIIQQHMEKNNYIDP